MPGEGQLGPEGKLVGRKPDLRIGVLLSGSGRTLANLLACIARGELPGRIVTVVSTRASVRGNEVAREAGIPLAIVPRRAYDSLDEFSAAVYQALDPYDLDLILMAGFLSKIHVPDRYAGRIMNIHPSLLPLFGGRGLYGDRVHQAVLASGMKVTGCTVHFVDESYDAGPIIAQSCVPVLESDTVETLAARVFAEECRLYPEAIRFFWQGRLWIDGRVVRIRPLDPS